MVTEISFPHQSEAAMLFAVKDLKQDWPRVFFRMSPEDRSEFEAACRDYGSLQNVCSTFARHFLSLDSEGRDVLLRQFRSSTPAPPKPRVPTRSPEPGDVAAARNAARIAEAKAAKARKD